MRSATLLLLAVSLAPAICYAQSEALSLAQILDRMQQAGAADQDHNFAYTVTREYQLLAAGATQASSDVVAEVSVIPPGEKQYVIVKSEGNERGAAIVRRVLDHEAGMADHPQSYAIDAANYDFALAGRETTDGHDCYVLQISPKRQAVGLLRGQVWVDAQDFRVRRIEGEAAKSPSLWLRKLNLTLNFGEVNGVWLETSTQAIADVRFAGKHMLTSRELEVRRATVSASIRRPRRHPPAGRLADDTAAWIAP